VFDCAGDDKVGAYADQGQAVLLALKNPGGQHPACPTEIPVCDTTLFHRLIKFASNECKDLYGHLRVGTFGHEDLCVCLGAAYDTAVLLGETMKDCMLFGETLFDRLHLCKQECTIVKIVDSENEFTDVWTRVPHDDGIYLRNAEEDDASLNYISFCDAELKWHIGGDIGGCNGPIYVNNTNLLNSTFLVLNSDEREVTMSCVCTRGENLEGIAILKEPGVKGFANIKPDMCIHRSQIYMNTIPTCIQITGGSRRSCDSTKMVCIDEASDDLAVTLAEVHEKGTREGSYTADGCGEGWDFTYVAAPENCHRVNRAMRDFLKHNNIDDPEVDDICYVENDQWYVEGHRTCIGAYPEGHYVECNGDNLVCAQTIGTATFYGDVLLQLGKVLDVLESPRYLHEDCPNTSDKAIERLKCRYRKLYRKQYCDDSIFIGLISLATCEARCTSDSTCTYVDYDPTSGCYHSQNCITQIDYENANVYKYSCNRYPDCDVDKMKTLGGEEKCGTNVEDCDCLTVLVNTAFDLNQACALPNGDVLYEKVTTCSITTHSGVCESDTYTALATAVTECTSVATKAVAECPQSCTDAINAFEGKSDIETCAKTHKAVVDGLKIVRDAKILCV
jgi:hypothetical protein